MLRSFVRLVTVVITCISLASAAAGWCVVGCHVQLASTTLSGASAAAKHCHAAAAASSTAWQAASTCSHQHDTAWTDAAGTARGDSKRLAIFDSLTAPVPNITGLSGIAAGSRIDPDGPLPTSAAPPGFVLPLRV